MGKKILIYILMVLMVFTTGYQVNAAADERPLLKERTIDPDKPMIALTFDDGPSKKVTPIILNTLKENDAVATFFVLGSEAEKNKELLNRIINEGNQVGNHTYNHKDITSLSDEELSEQLGTTHRIIKNLTGYSSTAIRPPYGHLSENVKKKVDLPIILWSLDTRDWENKNAEVVSKEILENVKDGDIVLMHDIYESTAEAAQIVIPELVKRGYQLVTVSELYEYRDTMMLAGNIYYNMYK